MSNIQRYEAPGSLINRLAVGMVALLVVFGPIEIAVAQDVRKPATIVELRQERQKMAHRQRRIIFNNDGDDVVYECKEATREALLAARTTPLLGSQVDSISYCTWSSGFSYFTHRTKLGQIFDSTADPVHPDNKTGGLSKNKTAEFIKQGTDPLQIMVEFCKTNRLEILWTFRTNDTHDAWRSWYGDLLFSKVQQDDTEWLVASQSKPSKQGGW